MSMLITVYIIAVKNKVCKSSAHKSKYLEVLEKALFNTEKINIFPTANAEIHYLCFEWRA